MLSLFERDYIGTTHERPPERGDFGQAEIQRGVARLMKKQSEGGDFELEIIGTEPDAGDVLPIELEGRQISDPKPCGVFSMSTSSLR